MLSRLPDELILYISRYLDPISLARFISVNNIFSLSTSVRRIKLYKINREVSALESIRKYALYNLCASFVQEITKEVLSNLNL